MRKPSLPLVLSLALGACTCAPIPEADPIPDIVVDERGDGDGPRLLSVQAFLQPADYATRARFEARLRGFLDEAADREMLNERTVVVLPEYTGSWLVAEGEGAGVYEQPELGGAMTDLAMAHLPGFLWRSWTAGVDDGDAFAAFSEKSERMAALYDDVMGTLAQEFAITLVGGSIILPDARIEDGVVVVTAGEPLQNVSVVYDASGDAIAISRKVFPTKDEQGFVSAAEPADIAVVDTPAGRLGVLVCADAWFPESYERLQAEGAELLAVPTFHSGDDMWGKDWNGYSGHQEPDDVDDDDIGTLTEATAWDKYALAGRAAAAGIKGAVSAPLRGSLWDMGDDGQAFLVDAEGFARMENVDAPGLFLLRLP
ncbi:MAG: carbon-nitrogen hydrolase family protein [Deltaproteobacteria bacterium]|nr:carbon-nitrogen hydrolase family protein [Deltaproteobacteria bacterium]